MFYARVTLTSLLAMCLAGCGDPPAPSREKPGGIRMVTQAPPMVKPMNMNGPRDAEPKVERLAHLYVYQLSVPYGSVSQNAEFWKHVDEQTIDVGTYDVLFRNGVRVGIAPVSDWAYFRNILINNPAETKPMACQGMGTSSVEIALKSDVAEQVLFFFNGHNDLEGRSYGRSSNVLCMEYSAAARKLDDMHVKLCPMVRTLRKRFVVDEVEEHKEYQYVYPERFYDCNLTTDISVGKFLVIAPSAEASWKVSLGRNFFVTDADAGLQEQVLLIVPQLFRMDKIEGK